MNLAWLRRRLDRLASSRLGSELSPALEAEYEYLGAVERALLEREAASS